jgi:membrane-bound lytic murein transglycosylase B
MALRVRSVLLSCVLATLVGLAGCVAFEGNGNDADARAPVPAAGLAVRGDGTFSGFLEALWPDAKARGVSRTTFDAAFNGITPDPSVIAVTRRQSEFVQPIWTYVANAASADRIAKGKEMATRWAGPLADAERRYGVPRSVVLAVWGMETHFGGYTGDKLVIRSVATLAQIGYRGDFFRNELLDALVILERKYVTRDTMRGSWAGAMGQTQFMPSSFLKYAVDHDGDGRRDIWTNPADAIGSTANYLQQHGWVNGLPWGLEVILPEGYNHQLRRGAFSAFAAAGVRRAGGGALPGNGEARLFYPAGAGGPVMLLTANFDVIKTYNMSDAYALGVGHLADRIAGGGALVGRWPVGETQLDKAQTQDVQRRLAVLGFDMGEIDGRIGTKTREAVAAVQARNAMVPDGWPTPAFLARLRAGAR